MLFKGGEKTDEFEDYVRDNGGERNAETCSEHTHFYFSINKNALRGALKRFAHFLVSPLFAPEAIDNEVKLVDKEFKGRLNKDACRLEQIQRYTSPHGHPFHRFEWGNEKSLYGAANNKEELREHIQKIHRDGYHAAAMKLVVISKDTLDTIEEWVHTFFGPIEKKDINPVKRKINEPIWKDGKIYWVEAVEFGHMLKLTWVLPPLREMYLEKPQEYLSYLLGNEKKGSLFVFLRDKGWVRKVAAGLGEGDFDSCSFASLFGVTIHLTGLGLQKINEIIGFVYQYIKILRDHKPQKWIYKKIQGENDDEFQSLYQHSDMDYANNLTAGLLMYPPTHVIYGDYVYKWNPTKIKYLLTFFYPSNMRVDVVTKLFEKTYGVETEPWFGSRYVVEDIPPNLLELWNNPGETDVNLHLPVKNDLLLSDWTISSETANGDSKNSQLSSGDIENSQLQCIVDESFMRIWYKQDVKVPQVRIFFNITLKEGHDDVEKALLVSLLGHLVKGELNQIISEAELAGGLSISVSPQDFQLELKFFGLKEKVMLFLKKVLEAKNSYLLRIDQFEVIKQDMEIALKNVNLDPSTHSGNLLSEVLFQNFWDVEKKLRSLEGLTFANLQAFIPDLLSQLYAEGFYYGNWLKEEVLEISNFFGNIFSVDKGPSVPSQRRHKAKILSLPARVELIRNVRVEHEEEKSSVVELYFQIQPKPKGGVSLIKLRAVTNLAYEILSVRFAELLRDTGCCYHVDAKEKNNHCMMGISFCALSSDYDPAELQKMMDDIVEKFEKYLKHLTKDGLEQEKENLIAKLLKKDSASEPVLLWGYIMDERSKFDSEKKVAERGKLEEEVAEEVKAIKNDDLVEWWNAYLKKNSQMRRKLSIRVWGCNTNGKDIDSPKAPIHFIKEKTKKRKRGYNVVNTKLIDFKKNGSWLDL